jgi:thiol peroxidase
MERKNAVTLHDRPLTLEGEELKVNEKAPIFNVLDTDLKDCGIADFKNSINVIACVPSLDTPVCDLEIKRFNKEATQLSEDVVVMFISMDLPFAQKRFCLANDIKRVKTFSDHRTADFGLKYGVLIKELRLLSRAVFVIDHSGILRYIEYVKEMSSHPNYDEVLLALKKIIAES